jgi:hypothetical protein
LDLAIDDKDFLKADILNKEILQNEAEILFLQKSIEKEELFIKEVRDI